MAVTLNASSSAGFVTTADTSTILQLQTNGTTAVTVDASQNVGIGTASPATRLHVSGNMTLADYGNIGATNNNAGISLTGGSTTNNGGQINLRGGSFGTANAIEFIQGGTEQARIDTGGVFKFNSGYGSVATAYGCRAWVNFNGTGTVAIRASGNVTSITDNGTGDYTVNFTTAMPDANYTPAIATQRNGVNSAVWGSVKFDSTMAASNVRIATVDVTPTPADPIGVFVAIFR